MKAENLAPQTMPFGTWSELNPLYEVLQDTVKSLTRGLQWPPSLRVPWDSSSPGTHAVVGGHSERHYSVEVWDQLVQETLSYPESEQPALSSNWHQKHLRCFYRLLERFASCLRAPSAFIRHLPTPTVPANRVNCTLDSLVQKWTLQQSRGTYPSGSKIAPLRMPRVHPL